MNGRVNYYEGRAKSDITKWVAYFTEGMAEAFEKVRDQAMAESATGARDQSKVMRALDAKQRLAFTLFLKSREITSKEIAGLFGCKPRTASALCQKWVEDEFIEIADPAKKSRRYKLTEMYEAIIEMGN